MTIKVGDRVPDGKLLESTDFDTATQCALPPKPLEVAAALAGKKIVIFGPARRRAPDHPRGRGRAGLRAQPGHRPPGHQAREHPPRRGPCAGGRLRDRAGDRGGGGREADCNRACNRHPGLDESGAGGGSRDIDGRSDLYSLGCIGFFAATGRPPFEADSAHKLLMQHLTTPAPKVASVRAEFPAGLGDVIARALEKTGGNKGPSAKLLNLKRTTLVEKLKRMERSAAG